METGNHKPSQSNDKKGVPQGLIPGPLTFILYVTVLSADENTSKRSFFSYFYVDDTVIKLVKIA